MRKRFRAQYGDENQRGLQRVLFLWNGMCSRIRIRIRMWICLLLPVVRSQLFSDMVEENKFLSFLKKLSAHLYKYYKNWVNPDT